MAHHSSEYDDQIRNFLGELGATGKFPQGKLTQADEGEIKFAVGSATGPDGKGKVAIEFGKPVHWMAMDAEQTRGLAMLLDEHADKIDPPQSGRIVLLDFDGVLHSYTSGWKGADTIPDPPVPGALEFLQSLIAHNEIAVCIYSSRSRQQGGVVAMKRWLLNNGLRPAQLGMIDFPTRKPAAFLTIDDRCIRFKGEWPSMEEITGFHPWRLEGESNG